MPKTSSDGNGTPVAARATRPDGREADVATVVDALRQVIRELRLAGRAAEQQVGIHGAQLHVLQQLAERPVTSLTGLAERTRTDISSVSTVVSRLVEQGLVARQAAVDDRRRLTIGLTPRGRALLRRAPSNTTDLVRQATEDLSARSLHGLAEGLTALAEGLRSVAKE